MIKNWKKVISQKREKQIAKDTGGQAHLGSGAAWNNKGDAHDEGFLYEDKFTKATYYTLSISTLKKIEKEALNKGHRLPVLKVGMIDKSNIIGFEFVVLRRKDCDTDIVPIYIVITRGKSIRLQKDKLVQYYIARKGLFFLNVWIRDEMYLFIEWSDFLGIREKMLEGKTT